MATPLLAVPRKTTDTVEFADAFSAYIQLTYQEDPSKYQTEINHLTKLRSDMCRLPVFFTFCSGSRLRPDRP